MAGKVCVHFAFLLFFIYIIVPDCARSNINEPLSSPETERGKMLKKLIRFCENITVIVLILFRTFQFHFMQKKLSTRFRLLLMGQPMKHSWIQWTHL